LTKPLLLIAVLAFAFGSVCLLGATPLTSAYVVTEDDFTLNFDSGEALAVQDTDEDITVTFSVNSGTWNGTGSLITDASGGTLQVTPTANGVLSASADAENVYFELDGLALTTSFAFTSGVAFTLTWEYTSSGVLPVPIDFAIGGDVTLLLTYLQQGDFLGFIAACYTSRIGQLFYVILALAVTIPLALRTQNVTYVAVVWLILAGIFQVVMPIVSPGAVLFAVLAVGALLYKLFTRD